MCEMAYVLMYVHTHTSEGWDTNVRRLHTPNIIVRQDEARSREAQEGERGADTNSYIHTHIMPTRGSRTCLSLPLGTSSWSIPKPSAQQHVDPPMPLLLPCPRPPLLSSPSFGHISCQAIRYIGLAVHRPLVLTLALAL